MKQEDIYYKAMLARDYRFDGKFFVGVKTTGIFCRPICPAKPKRINVEFFTLATLAEKAGYRPCLRCRPESAPRSPAWRGTSAVVQRALKTLHTHQNLQFDENKFAELFGVSARHLRRLFIEEIGKTPKQLSFENRLNLARKLISETALPITEVAFASGFSSVRRFNDSFKDRFKRSPRESRRTKIKTAQPLILSLSYRPPFDFEGLIRQYDSHRMGNLEWFINSKMHRVISLNGKVGKIVIANDSINSCLRVEIDFPDTSQIHNIVEKVRQLFDLDSDPVLIANSLETDADLKKLLKKYPGIRIATGWDAFETSIAIILGQLVSVDRGRVLIGDLIELTGTDSGLVRDDKKIKLFPSPQSLATANLENLGTTRIRKQTLIAFSQALTEGTLSLESTQDVDQFIKKVQNIKGIGPWTAHYMAMKVLKHTDSFPGSDLILARALAKHPIEVIEKMHPWKGYVAALFWRAYA